MTNGDDTVQIRIPREGDRIRERMRNLNRERERLFRVNSGTGFCGSKMRRVGTAMIIQDPRPLHAAPAGWPDLCGWTSVEITPDMVGETLAVFTGEEFKRGPRDKPSDDQRRFGELLERMGGIYRVVIP